MLLSLRWWCGKACMVGLLALCIFPAFAAMGGAAGNSGAIMPELDVKDAPLATVVLLLTQQSGINFVIADPEVNTKRVTAHLKNQPMDKVLELVLKPAGIRYHKTEDGTYVIGDSGADVTQAVEPPVQQLSAAQPEPEQPKRRARTESVKLQNTSPSELLRVLAWKGDMMGPDAPKNVIDVDEVFPWKPTTPNKAGVYGPKGIQTIDKNGNSTNEPVPPVVDQLAPKGPLAGRTADTAEGAAQYPGASARPSYGGAQGYGGQNNYGGQRPNNAMPNQNSSGGNGSLLPEGIDFVMPYDIDNSIVVRGDDEGIAEFKDLVHMLDIPPKQVQIKAEFIEVSTTDTASLGIDWSIQRLNSTFNTAFKPTGNVVIGVQTGNVSAELKAELSRTKGRVVNSPIISTLNNTPASIEIGKTIPFFSSTTQSVGDGQLVTSQQLTELPVETYLFCLPRVNGDGSITLYLEPSVQDTGRMFTSGEQQFPERSYQTVRTNRRVMNGETIVVGGFVRKNDTASINKVPILGDLPLIGSLFRSKSDQQDERELLIFVTPTIIPDKSGGSVGVQP